jgi:hypothetical protein
MTFSSASGAPQVCALARGRSVRHHERQAEHACWDAQASSTSLIPTAARAKDVLLEGFATEVP